MSIVDRINQLVLGRLRRPRARLAVAGEALLVDDHAYPLPELAGLVAYEADVYAGLLIALALSFGGGRTFTVTQEDACWNDLLAALDRLKLTTMPSREWLTAMVAGGGQKQPMVVLRERYASM